jgi:hypothetical protein
MRGRRLRSRRESRERAARTRLTSHACEPAVRAQRARRVVQQLPRRACPTLFTGLDRLEGVHVGERHRGRRTDRSQEYRNGGRLRRNIT